MITLEVRARARVVSAIFQPLPELHVTVSYSRYKNRKVRVTCFSKSSLPLSVWEGSGRWGALSLTVYISVEYFDSPSAFLKEGGCTVPRVPNPDCRHCRSLMACVQAENAGSTRSHVTGGPLVRRHRRWFCLKRMLAYMEIRPPSTHVVLFCCAVREVRVSLPEAEWVGRAEKSSRAGCLA